MVGEDETATSGNPLLMDGSNLTPGGHGMND